MTGRGSSSRVRRKPQTVYDTAPLASEEQLSQQSEDEGRNRTAGGGRRPSKKQKTAAGTRGAKTTAAAKGRGRGGARKSRSGGGGDGGVSSDDGRVSEEEQEEGAEKNEGEEEEEEEEDPQEKSALGKRKKRARRASAPPAPSGKSASRGAKNTGGKKKARGRKSTGGIPTSRKAATTSAAEADGEESEGEDGNALGGAVGGGMGGRGAENGLMEAVLRNDTALSSVVSDWVSSYKEDSDKAMKELLNFVFLACGAPSTEGPYGPPSDVSVIEMDGEQWVELLKVVIEDMQGQPGTKGAPSFPLAPAAKGKSGKPARIFRSNYCEVFNRLAEACRRGDDHDASTLEAVVGMLVALSSHSASQDIRLAATLAGMEMGLGVAEELAGLREKLGLSERQLEAAKSSAGKGGGKKAAEKSRKIQGLESQVERVFSATETLTTVSDLVFSKITQKRYRDVSPLIRSIALEGLSKIMLALPEFYVQDKLMRYHGWSLNDKNPAVRVLALQSIQRLLRDPASSARLEKFSAHFFSRVKAMIQDVDSAVAREAGVALRLMLSNGFLESIERADEMDIEAGIFEEGLGLPARTECMGFFVDGIQEFEETDAEKAAAAAGGGKGKKAAVPTKKGKKRGAAGSNGDEDEDQMSVIRLEALAQLVSTHGKELVEEERHEEQLLACADLAVQAMWGLPQAPVVRRWRALFTLLENDESGVGEGGGSLDGGEQTVVAKMLLRSAQMAAAEAKTGRRAAAGYQLGKEAKQEVREAVAELAEACLTHLPNLLAKYQSDDAKLALLAELPTCIPSEALASLVSGSGKGAFSDLVSRMKDAFLMSNSPLVMDAAASSLGWFLNADHAKRAEVKAVVQGMVEELFAKVSALCQQDQKATPAKGKAKGAGGKGRWKDTGIGLANSFRRLRCLAGCTDASGCVDGTTLSEAWEGVQGAVRRRCLLDEVLPAKTLPSQHQERLDVARGVVEEGSNVLYSLFLWQIKPLFSHLMEAGSSAPAPASEAAAAAADGGSLDDGDAKEPTPAKGKKRGRGKGKKAREDEENTLGDRTLEVEEITEEKVQEVVRYRDDLVEVLRAMLAMHLYPRRNDEEEEDEGQDQGGRGAARGGGAVTEDGIEGVPRVLTADQKMRLVGPVRLAAWRLANELRTALKEALGSVEGPFASLSWVPDVPFTRLLQEHFEEMEEVMVASTLRGPRQQTRSSKTNNGRVKVEHNDDDDDDDGDGGGDSSDNDNDNGEGDEVGVDTSSGGGDTVKDAGLLLMPLMKSIYSNADKLNRRQAAAVVAHLVRSGKTGSGFAKCFVSKLKDHSPVKCLEVHMATLRVFYDKWVVAAAADGNVEEDDADLSDDEKTRKQWDQDLAGMERWLPLARRLSMSLGVGPLKSKDLAEQKTLQDLFLGFMKVGVRFALDAEGDRLLFLEGMREYSSKVTARQKKALAKAFDDEAKGLHDQVLEEGRENATSWDSGEGQEDVAPRWRAFFSFRSTLTAGSAASFIPEGRGYASSGDASSVSPSHSASGSSMGTPASRGTKRRAVGSGVSSTSSAGGGGSVKRRGRVGGRVSMASVRSRRSVASDLMPVAEEDGMQQDEQLEDNPEGEEEEEDREDDAMDMGQDGEEGVQEKEGKEGHGNDAGEEEEEEEEEEESPNLSREVRTPNKLRDSAAERLRASQLEEEEEEEEDDLLNEDRALNPSVAAPRAAAAAAATKTSSNKRKRRGAA